MFLITIIITFSFSFIFFGNFHVLVSLSVSKPCRAPLFSCRNNRCVFLDWVLDGRDDCIDQSDEGMTHTSFYDVIL